MEVKICPECGSEDIEEKREDKFKCIECGNLFSPDDFLAEEFGDELEQNEEDGDISTAEAGFVRGYGNARSQDVLAKNERE